MPPRIVTATKDEVAERHALYADLEEFITPGFVSQRVSVAGVHLGMRTLFPGEMFVLRHRLSADPTPRAWQEWAVASSVWMIDGQVVLGDANAAVRVRESLLGFPKSALEMLFSVFTSLHNRVRKALSRLEAYCYEDFARTNWRMVGRQSPARLEIAGVPGVTALGMNHVQRLWMAYNLAEDDRQAWNLEWAAAKLVASATSPKGVKKLSQRDESERKVEEERRKAVIARTYYESTGKSVGETNGMVVSRSVSPEELVDEMNRWVQGERDLHDQVIEAYKNTIRAQHEAERARHEERMQKVATLQAEVEAIGGPSIVGYTAEQLRELRGESRPRRGTTVVASEGATRVFEKFVSREVLPGGLVDGGKGVPIAPDAVDSALDEVVAGRRVRLTDDGGRH